jgi:hypothetical protein
MGLCELPSSSFLRVPASASFASSILREGETRKGRGGDGKNKELVSNVTPSTIMSPNSNRISQLSTPFHPFSLLYLQSSNSFQSSESRSSINPISTKKQSVKYINSTAHTRIKNTVLLSWLLRRKKPQCSANGDL